MTFSTSPDQQSRLATKARVNETCFRRVLHHLTDWLIIKRFAFVAKKLRDEDGRNRGKGIDRFSPWGRLIGVENRNHESQRPSFNGRRLYFADYRSPLAGTRKSNKTQIRRRTPPAFFPLVDAYRKEAFRRLFAQKDQDAVLCSRLKHAARHL